MHSKCTVTSPRAQLKLASSQPQSSKEKNSTRRSAANSTGSDKTSNLRADRLCTNHEPPNGTASDWTTLTSDRMPPTTARIHQPTEHHKVVNTPSSSSLQATLKRSLHSVNTPSSSSLQATHKRS